MDCTSCCAMGSDGDGPSWSWFTWTFPFSRTGVV
jgi:hypothetical protein